MKPTFWETEYAYISGEPRADSLAASFLRYPTDEVGKDIVRSYGNRPCAELENPGVVPSLHLNQNIES